MIMPFLNREARLAKLKCLSSERRSLFSNSAVPKSVVLFRGSPMPASDSLEGHAVDAGVQTGLDSVREVLFQVCSKMAWLPELPPRPK